MLKVRHILLVVLLLGTATIWMPQRVALSVVESAAFLVAGARMAWLAWRGRPIVISWPLVAVLSLCLWAAAQLLLQWTVVRSETRAALLYWLAGASLVWLGGEACPSPAAQRAFLKNALAAGAVVCFAGILQLYTSHGRVFWMFASGYEFGVIGPFVSANNFACFVELLLPTALALSVDGRRTSTGYLLTAGALVAAVVASGSRGGAVLVAAESAAVFALCRKSGGHRVWFKFSLVAAVGSLILGYEGMWRRFAQGGDPYQFRREFLESSLAMIRARPWHGFGLGTWPSVYPQFALFDAGTFVNHAHNEWAQWAAEGGLVALGLMVFLCAWCWKPALRSIWGFGVLAVFLHSLVDYPFLRLGLAAWVFVWIGALAAAGHDRFPAAWQTGAGIRSPAISRFLATVLALVLVTATLESGRVGYADTLYRQGRANTVAEATRLCPDRAEYWAAMAADDPPGVTRHWRQALVLNPYLTAARLALAWQMEQQGDPNASEAMLLEAARLDRQSAPAWAAVNFYFRAGRSAQFWDWAHRVAGLERSSLAPLFDLCFLMSGDVAVTEQHVAASRPDVERQLLHYLVVRRRGAEGPKVALRVSRAGVAGDRDPLLDYIDQALDGNRGSDAVEIWNEACVRGLFRLDPVQPGALVNGDFREPLINRGFDWRLPSATGVFATQSGGVLQVTFSGREPESCEVLSPWTTLRENALYRLRFAYRTDGLPQVTGLSWSLEPGDEQFLVPAPDWNSGECRFRPGHALRRLRLSYRRFAGTTRIEGALWLRQVQLEPL